MRQRLLMLSLWDCAALPLLIAAVFAQWVVARRWDSDARTIAAFDRVVWGRSADPWQGTAAFPPTVAPEVRGAIVNAMAGTAMPGSPAPSGVPDRLSLARESYNHSGDATQRNCRSQQLARTRVDVSAPSMTTEANLPTVGLEADADRRDGSMVSEVGHGAVWMFGHL
jgi:hypothetical protein